MSLNQYNPIPEGYITLVDFAEKHGRDIVELACAASRGDLETQVFTLKVTPGVNYLDTKVLIVKEDAQPPWYVGPSKIDPPVILPRPRRIKPPYSVEMLAQKLGISDNTTRKYLAMLGIDIKTVQTEEQAEDALAKLADLLNKRRKGNVLAASGFKLKTALYVPTPEGYESVYETALRLGVSRATVHGWALGHLLPTIKRAGRRFVKVGAYPNHWSEEMIEECERKRRAEQWE